MSIKNDGGQAFPSGAVQDADCSRTFEHPMYGGMSLRDYFAAAALTGLASQQANLTASDLARADSQVAYIYADAMLAERAK